MGYHGNKGRPEANFDDAVKLSDSGNPTFGKLNILLLYLKMPELLPFEVAIGRNANVQIFGVNMKIYHPYPKGTSLRENASFDV